jgi:hypothetical protein
VKASLCGQYFHSMGQVIELSLARYYNCQNTMTQIKANVRALHSLSSLFWYNTRISEVYKITKSAEKLERLQYGEIAQ